ncbi:unnamed protein product [Durusdinium trenchii]|uniref:EF-hand domain-containing protein n=2 Tax=Durusdinium trenchii TaxID=1381693 RepID=A0ABP0SV66_9DINO
MFVQQNMRCCCKLRQLKIDRLYGYLNGPVEEVGLIPELGQFLKCGRSEMQRHRHWIDSKCGRIVSNLALWLNVVLFVVVGYFHKADWQTLQLDPILQGCYCGVELVFLAFFSYELWQRHRSTVEGLDIIDAFMKTGWNCYDAFLMGLCFIDACVLNFIPLPQVQAVHNLVLLLAPAFQILRLGRVVTELRLIILGILRAMRAVFWAMVLLTLVVYFFAVFSVHYVREFFKDDTLTADLFKNMGEAMFTLFSFATLEDYTTTVRHFMRSGVAGVIVAVCIVVFILFANLALLNLLTAIMVDAIVDILPKKRSELLTREKATLVKKLKVLFRKMDEPVSKRVSCAEFKKNMDQHVEDELGKLQIASSDLNELFKLIDFTGAGALSEEEFIDGLMRMSPSPASKRELLEVQHDLHRMWNMLSVGQERLREQLNELNGIVKEFPLQLSTFMDEVKEMHEKTFEACVSERDASAQRLTQQFETMCSKLPHLQEYKPDEHVQTQLKEMQQSLAELSTSRLHISEQLVQVLEEIQAQQSAIVATTQPSLLSTFEAPIQAETEKETPETGIVTKVNQQTQTTPSGGAESRGYQAQISTQSPQAPFAPLSLPMVPPGFASFPSNAWPVVPYTGQLQAALQEMKWAYPDLVGPPSPYADERVRVVKVLHWLQAQRWQHLPFDRLILRLEGAGIQLSEEEQDLLKCWLTHGPSGQPHEEMVW